MAVAGIDAADIIEPSVDAVEGVGNLRADLGSELAAEDTLMRELCGLKERSRCAAGCRAGRITRSSIKGPNREPSKVSSGVGGPWMKPFLHVSSSSAGSTPSP